MMKRFLSFSLAMSLLCAVSAAESRLTDLQAADGKLSMQVWMDSGKEVTGPEGWNRIAYFYEGDELVRREYQDAGGHAIRNRTDGFSAIVYRWKNHKLASETYVDETGQPVAGPEGWSSKAYQYARSSRTPEKVSWLDLDGNPCLNGQGYASMTIKVDGTRTVEAYFGINGERCCCKDGYARVSIKRTSFGEISNMTYNDTDYKATMVPTLGYASMECTYRGKTLTSVSYLDENKKPVDASCGYAFFIQNVTKSNKPRDAAYTHADGSPATGGEGWSSVTYTLDKAGNITSALYLDEEGQPLINPTPDLRGQTVQTLVDSGTRLILQEIGMDNQPVWPVRVKTLSDLDGRILRDSLEGADGNPVPNADGVFAVQYIYDEAGRIIGIRYQDRNGQPMLSREGYAGWNDTINAAGFPEQRLYLDENEEPALLPDGSSGYRIVYNAFLQASEQVKIMADGSDFNEPVSIFSPEADQASAPALR